MNRDRNKVQAGVFVLFGIVLAIVVIVLLSNITNFLQPMQTISVRYVLADGVAGLKPGATVSIGGVESGQVTDIRDVFDPDQPGRLIAKDVVLEIPAHYQVFDNARIELIVPPIGTGTSVNLAGFGYDAGSETGYVGDSWTYETDEVLPGRVGVNPLVSNLTEKVGIGDQQRQEIQEIIASVRNISVSLDAKQAELDEIIARANAFMGKVDTRGEKILIDLDAVMTEAKALVADARSGVNEAKAGIEQTRVIVSDAQKKWTDLWSPRFDTITGNVDTASGELKEALAESRPVIKRTVDQAEAAMNDVKAVAARFRETTLPDIEKSVRTARESIDDIRETTNQLKTSVITQRPILERTLANARITSDQLKLASIEIRRSPWRLLYTPDKEEIATDNLYDAARNFSEAATTLESSSDSLRALLDRYGETIDPNDAELKRLMTHLQDTFDKFGTAEKKFWDALDEQPSE